MAQLFDSWPADRLLEVVTALPTTKSLSLAGISILCPNGALSDAEFDRIQTFNPDLVYVRANEWPEAWWDFGHDLALSLDIPYVAHLFDDVVAWNFAKFRTPVGELRAIRRDLSIRRLVRDASAMFSCSEKHSEWILDHYGVSSVPFVRWVSPIATAAATDDGVFRFAYSGRCNPIQHSHALHDVARAILDLKEAGLTIVIDCIGPNVKDFEAFFALHPETVSVLTFHGDYADRADQLEFLGSRDATLAAFNFDEPSICYVGKGTSSKAIDALGSDRPTLVYGPLAVETVAWANRTGWADVVTDRDLSSLKTVIRDLVTRRGLTEAQRIARVAERERWSRSVVLGRFEKEIRRAADLRQYT